MRPPQNARSGCTVMGEDAYCNGDDALQRASKGGVYNSLGNGFLIGGAVVLVGGIAWPSPIAAVATRRRATLASLCSRHRAARCSASVGS
jgi:hypothetical protein